MLTGPDVSHWQGAVDWSAMRRAGHAFAWCKASEGTGFVDSRFGANWPAMRAAGLVRGAYHFLRSETDPRQQARHFVGVVGDFNGSMAAVDVETSGAGTNPTSAQARAFAAEFAALTGGHVLVVYTGGWYWRGVLGDPHGADIGPLWHSRFSSAPGPLYGGWGGWAFWQHTDSGAVPGVQGACDLNQFAYDMAALAGLTGGHFAQEEDDLPYSEAQLRNIIRSVLDEGTGAGQIGWAGTNKNILATAQGTFNQVERTRRTVLASRINVDALVQKIVDALEAAPSADIDRAAVETAVRSAVEEADGES